MNKANTSDTEVPFLDLHLSISSGFVSYKIYDMRDELNFYKVSFRFFRMVTFPVVPLMEYTFQNVRIRFARMCSHVSDFNARSK